MKFRSKLIVEFETRLRETDTSNHQKIIDQFWKEIESIPYPIKEPLEEGNIEFNPDNYELITFLYRSSKKLENVFLLAEMNFIDPRDYLFTHIDNTDIYYKSIPLPKNATAQYRIFENDPLDGIFAGAKYANRWDRFHEHPDPLSRNIDGIKDRFGPGKDLLTASIRPFGDDDPGWWDEIENSGKVEELEHNSSILGYSRNLYIYTPYEYDPSKRYKFLLIHDGSSFLKLVKVGKLLDNLIERQIIDPVIAIFTDSGMKNGSTARYEEYPPNNKFVQFISSELLPWVRERYSLSDDPSDGIVAGSSYGGMAAFWYGYSASDKIANVLSLSGSFHWGKEDDGYGYEWIPNQIAFAETAPIRLYLEVGKLEGEYHPNGPDFPNQIVSHRHFCTILKMKGYDYFYLENTGDHSETTWRTAFKRGLLHFWGK